MKDEGREKIKKRGKGKIEEGTMGERLHGKKEREEGKERREEERWDGGIWNNSRREEKIGKTEELGGERK